jgi:hypothetical protein
VLAEETRADNNLPGTFILQRPPGSRFRPGAGAIMLSNRAEVARILPQQFPGQFQGAGPGGAGRGLDAYRAGPVRVAARTDLR